MPQAKTICFSPRKGENSALLTFNMSHKGKTTKRFFMCLHRRGVRNTVITFYKSYTRGCFTDEMLINTICFESALHLRVQEESIDPELLVKFKRICNISERSSDWNAMCTLDLIAFEFFDFLH